MADGESRHMFKDGIRSKGEDSVGVPFSRGGESSQDGRKKFGTFTRSNWGRKTGQKSFETLAAAVLNEGEETKNFQLE